MLEKCEMVSFVSTRDGARALAFYRDVLGLRLVEESPFALVLEGRGATLRIQKTPDVVVAPYTALGWNVDDIAAAVDHLASRGVVFSRYEGMGQDARGVWAAPGGAQVAWFKDPDGHTLSLTQHPA